MGWKRWTRWVAILAAAAVVTMPVPTMAQEGGSQAACALLRHATPQAIAALEGTPSLATLLQGCDSSTGQGGDASGSAAICAALANLPSGGGAALSSLRQGCTSGQTPSQSFSDLGGFGWASGAISQLAHMKILRGVGHGRFDPGGTLTRAQFATLVMRVFNLQPPASGATTFVDVPAGFWAAGAIAAAAPYMTEYKTPGGVAFEPNLPATRIDVAATIGELEVTQGAAQLPSVSAAATIWAAFSDGGSVPPGVAQAAAVAVQLGLMKGYPNGAFGVEDPISRAEAAVLLQRVLAAGETIGSSGAPTVTAVTPDSGPATGGSVIAISGTGFASGATVAFGGTPATAVNLLSPTLITAVAPAGTGTVTVTVTTSAGTSAAGQGAQFTYTCTNTQTVTGSVYCSG